MTAFFIPGHFFSGASPTKPVKLEVQHWVGFPRTPGQEGFPAVPIRVDILDSQHSLKQIPFQNIPATPNRDIINM